MPKLSIIFAIALISAAPMGVAAARAEGVQANRAQVALSTRGVNFADQSQVKAFYDRVVSAARAVCNGDTLTPWGVREGEECRSRFISDAVNQVNAPLLTAMNNSATRKSSAYAADDR